MSGPTIELPQDWRTPYDLGWSVIPVEPRGKHPLGPWKPYQSERASLATVEQWAARQSNIGIVTGTVSRLIVLDLDSREAVEAAHERGLPDTITARTGKGLHVYFEHPGGTISNRAGIFPGADLRGDGGYVIAPGSIHPSGAQYRWEHPPGLFDLAPPPQWLLDLLAKPEAAAATPRQQSAPANAYGERALDGELSALRRATEGCRNDALNRAAFNLAQLAAGGVIEEQAAKSHLRATAQAIGLEAGEIAATIESGWKSGEEHPRRPEPIRKGGSTHLQPGFHPLSGDTIDQPREPEPLPCADLQAWDGTTPRPKAFIVAPFFPKGEITSWDGDGATNKSTGGQQLATCRAAGVPFLGLDVEPGKTLYVTAEDDFDRLHWIQAHICEALGVSVASLAGKLFLSSVRGSLNNELATFEHDGRIRPTPAFARLKATLQATGADLLILDNKAHLFAGNENDRAQVTAFINLLYSLNVPIILIGHRNKSGDTYSGSTAWVNAVRSQVVSERPDPLDPDARTLTLGKANYARQGAELRYRWHNFALWLEDDLPADTRAEIADCVRINGENERFRACLAACTERRRAVSHHKGSNYYATIFAGMAEAKGLKRDAFERAFERLLAIGEIEIDAKLWQRENRVWKYGIRATEKCTDPPAPTPSTDPHRTSRTDPHAPTPLYPADMGAALEAAAPDPMEGTEA